MITARSRTYSQLLVVPAAVVLLLGLLVLTEVPASAAGCAVVAHPAQQANPTKIMIAGDSITTESSGDYTWRYRFWKDLTRDGDSVDFVGGFDDFIDPVTLDYHQYAYADCDFDWDHESRPGARLFDYQNPTLSVNDGVHAFYPGATSWMSGATAAYQPDVLIVFAGSNDLARIAGVDDPVPSGTTDDELADIVLARLKKTVDEARAGDPGVDIILTNVREPLQGNVNRPRFIAYNQKLEAAVASPAWQQAGSTLYLLDTPDWTDNKHSWDGGHPDAVGEVIIANAFDDAVHAVLPSLPGQRVPTLPLPEIGPTKPAVLSLGAVTPTTVGLTWVFPPGGERTLIYARDVTVGGTWTKKVDLSWDRPAGELRGFRTYFPNIGDASCIDGCTAWTVGGLVAGHQYDFRLVSAKGLAVAPTITSNVVTRAGSPAPVSVKAPTAGVHAATLSWSPVPGASGYKVYWRKAATATWSGPLSTQTTLSRTLTGLAPGVKYSFAVTATKTGFADGIKSAVVSTTPKYRTIAAPSKPRLKALAGRKLRATWTAKPGATRYLVQVRLGSKVVKQVFVTKNTYTSGALVRKKTYSVRIRPYDGAFGGGTSAASSIKVK